ncbi:MAG: hypothetical protein P4L34_10570 [Paludibacter sp.]|nr:hypothetical protein [Paludibacter sp.]
MKCKLLACLVFGSVFILADAQRVTSATAITKEKTSFQTRIPWRPTIDVRSDVAMVYGMDDRPDMTFENNQEGIRVKLEW